MVLVIKTTSAVSIILSKSPYEGNKSNSDLKMFVFITSVLKDSEFCTYVPEDALDEDEGLELDWKL